MTHKIAVVREVSASIGRCELSFVDRAPIDLALARQQHAAYTAALRDAGCEVIALAPLDTMADAVFVEDVAVVVDEIAVMTRPGAVTRRDEGASVEVLLARYRPVVRINAPGTIDGGDVLRCGRRVFVGLSARSNAAGIDQLRDALKPFGYSVEAITTRGCLHLKSAVTELADDVLLINPEWIDKTAFADFCLLEVDPSEAHAANALRVNDQLIYADNFPRTLKRLRDSSFHMRTLTLSELQKAEGAVTCCSLLLNEASPA